MKLRNLLTWFIILTLLLPTILINRFTAARAAPAPIAGSQDGVGLAPPPVPPYRPLRVPGNPILNPIPNTHTASQTTSISITYDEAIDETTVSPQTFAVHAMETGLLAEAFSVNGGEIKLTPNQPFKPGELVQVSATTGTLNLSGQGPTSPTVWQFRATALGGSGVFTDSGQMLGNSSSWNVTLGDLDGDGDLDAFSGNSSSNRVWLNDGGGIFISNGQTLGSSTSQEVALGDLDGDGDLDAFIVNSSLGPAAQVWLNNGSGLFIDSGQALLEGYSARGAALGDLDGDGDLDAFVTNCCVGTHDKVLLNDGLGNFSATDQELVGFSVRGEAVALGDFDADGDLDAFVVNTLGEGNEIWLNNGDGTFNPIVQKLGNANSLDVALGDLDGDGDLDAFVGNFGPNEVWLNNGTGIFIDTGQRLGSSRTTGVALGDVDGDGDLDAFASNSANQANKVWLNDGTGIFTDSGQSLGNSNNFGVALGDVDGDGDLDALVGDFSEGNEVWLNQNAPPVPFHLTKTASTPIAQPGDTLTYTLIITAEGGGGPVTLTDTLPISMTYVSGSVTGGAVYSNGHILYDGFVFTGSPVTITYQAAVDPDVQPGSILYNSAVVTGAGQRLERSVAVAVEDPTPVANLVLLYVNGDNDLSDPMLELINKAELEADNPNAITLLLLDGPGEGDARLYQLAEDHDGSCPNYDSLDCAGRYIEGQNMWTWGENTGNPYSLAEFVKGAVRAYPNAEQVVLSLVGHGGGWSPNLLAGQPTGHGGQPGDELGGLLWDDHPGDSLSTPELGDALRWAYQATGRKIDLLYLDACLMAMWEVAYEVHDSVDYLLASENWSWTSFSYDAHLASLDGTKTPTQIGQAWMENEANVLRADDYPFTFSLVDLSQMPSLTQAIDNLATELTAVLPTDKTKIEAAFTATDCFDSNQDGPIDQQDTYCDLGSFARQVEVRSSGTPGLVNAAQTVQTTVADAVLAEDHHNGTPWLFPNQVWSWDELGGLSIYLPLGQDEWKRRYYTRQHLQAAQDSNWDEFLSAYWDNAEPPDDPDCSEGCPLPPGPIPPVIPPTTDDLLTYSNELWTLPIIPSANGATQIGLVVHRQGGKETLTDVKVDFYNGDPDAGGTFLGEGIIPLLSPRSSDSTTAIAWTPPSAGTYALYAVIDPDETITETLETNNKVSRTITVQPPKPDMVAPHVDSFSINNGAETTTVQTVTLNTTVSDPAPSSGLGLLYFVEYRYLQAIGLWAPVQFAGWFDYESARTDYAWLLHPTAGVKYIRAWAADNASNISTFPSSATINYIPPVDYVSQGQGRIYRYHLEVGQHLTALVEPVQGDPDLYIWPPDYDQGRPSWVSNLADGIDEVSFQAPVSGDYQVEVYGYTTASYHLTVEVSDTRTANSIGEGTGGISQDKPQNSQPLVPLDSSPNERFMPPPPPLKVYLPLILR